MQTITADELARWRADPARRKPALLDVREPWEVAICRLDGALEIPMREVPAAIDRLDTEAPLVCVCHHGARSLQVAQFLEARGVRDVYNLTGGIDAWSRLVDPALPRY